METGNTAGIDEPIWDSRNSDEPVSSPSQTPAATSKEQKESRVAEHADTEVKD